MWISARDIVGICLYIEYTGKRKQKKVTNKYFTRIFENKQFYCKSPLSDILQCLQNGTKPQGVSQRVCTKFLTWIVWFGDRKSQILENGSLRLDTWQNTTTWSSEPAHAVLTQLQPHGRRRVDAVYCWAPILYSSVEWPTVIAVSNWYSLEPSR